MSTKCDEDSHPREWILFESIDADGDQVLQKSEVEAYFDKLGMPNVAEELCEQLDKNNDGAIDFDEFVDGYSLFKQMLNRQWEEYAATSPDPTGRSSPVSLTLDTTAASNAEGHGAPEPTPAGSEPEPEPEPETLPS